MHVNVEFLLKNYSYVSCFAHVHIALPQYVSTISIVYQGHWLEECSHISSYCMSMCLLIDHLALSKTSVLSKMLNNFNLSSL